VSLARKAGMPALWVEIDQAVEAGGPKALQIAFYDIQQLPDIMRVIQGNRVTPGHAAELLETARTVDAKGRETPIMRDGAALHLARRYSLSCNDLTRGMSWKDMAALAGLSNYDTRLRPLCKAISVAALKAWGMELGWFRGHFRVLTAKQSAEKETKLLKDNVGGGVRRSEKKLAIATNKGLKSSGTADYQVMLFEGVLGESDDLPN
jgi:hypothetical protein